MTRVVKANELGRPDERLREQMKKLELFSREGGAYFPCAVVNHACNMYSSYAVCIFPNRDER